MKRFTNSGQRRPAYFVFNILQVLTRNTMDSVSEFCITLRPADGTLFGGFLAVVVSCVTCPRRINEWHLPGKRPWRASKS